MSKDHLTENKPFDVSKIDMIEDDIADMIQSIPTIDNSREITRLTAEAVSQQYEATAKAVDMMGTDLKMYSLRLERMLVEIDDELKRVSELAEYVREEGKRRFEEIEHTSRMISDVRDACTVMRERINNVGKEEK